MCVCHELAEHTASQMYVHDELAGHTATLMCVCHELAEHCHT